MNDTQWQGTWNRGQSLPRRNLSGSRAGRFASSSVSSEFSSVKWNADVTVLWGQGIIYPLYSFQSYCPAPQSANKDHLLLFCVCIECGKFLKVYPFLPWCLNLIKESSETLVIWNAYVRFYCCSWVNCLPPVLSLCWLLKIFNSFLL